MDEILNYAEDVICTGFMPTFEVPDGPERIAARAKLIAPDGVYTKFFTRLSNIIKANGSGFLVGPGITIADLKIVGSFLFEVVNDGFPATLIKDSYPELEGLLCRVSEHPKVAEWRAAHQ